MIRSPDEIYVVLDTAFESITKPVTCVELMDRPEIKGAAINRWGRDVQRATEKLSDTLGFMWRRGVLDRFDAPPSRNSRSKFAYAKKGIFNSDGSVITYTPPEKTKNKGDLQIIEKDGELVIHLSQFTIVIRPK